MPWGLGLVPLPVCEDWSHACVPPHHLPFCDFSEPAAGLLSPHYLEDIKHSRPEIFVDAVHALSFMWFDWTEKDRIESFPELAKFIHENYHVAVAYPPDPRVSYRIYVLNGAQPASPVKPGPKNKS